jgi:transcriptional regulator with XRE-family HTH domain
MTDSELRALRRAAGLTQKEIAQSLDVTTRTIKNWESGATEPAEPYKSAFSKLAHLREKGGAGAVNSAVRGSGGLIELANTFCGA